MHFSPAILGIMGTKFIRFHIEIQHTKAQRQTTENQVVHYHRNFVTSGTELIPVIWRVRQYRTCSKTRWLPRLHH